MKVDEAILDYITNKYNIVNIDAVSLIKRFISAVSWGVVGSVISRLSLLVTSIIIARMLGVIKFGEYGILISTVQLFTSLSGLGLGLTAVKYVSQYRENDLDKTQRIMSATLLLAFFSGLGMMLVLLAASHFICTEIISASHISGLLKISAPMLLFGTISGVSIGIMQGLELFKKIARINLITGIITFIIASTAVYFYGLTGVVAASVLIQFFVCIIYGYFVYIEFRRRKLRFSFFSFRYEYKLLIGFSLPAFLSNVLVGPVMWIASTMLVNQPNGYRELGLFTAADQWKTILLYIPAIIGASITPIMSERFGQGYLGDVRKTVKVTMTLAVIAVVPAGIALSIASPWVMSQYGEDYSSGWLVLTVILLTACVMAIQLPVGFLIAASGRMWVGFIINSAWAFVFLSSFTYFKNYGALGIAISLFISYSLHTIWSALIASAFFKNNHKSMMLSNVK